MLNDESSQVSSDSKESLLFSKKDIIQSLGNVDLLLLGGGTRNVPWSRLWGALHGIKGDLMVMDEEYNLQPAIDLIESMRGESLPLDFSTKWDQVHYAITRAIDNM